MITVLVHLPEPANAEAERTLQAFREQSLPHDSWEQLPLDPSLGKMASVLAGFAAGQGDVFVLLQAGEVLAPDYLETVAEIAASRPDLGAWGGSVRAEFETSIPAELAGYVHDLGFREIDRPLWARLPGFHAALPGGAGMCVRRAVLETYVERDLHPSVLDLALTAWDANLGAGLFPKLRVRRYFPEPVGNLADLTGLVEDAEYVRVCLEMRRGYATHYPPSLGAALVFALRSSRLAQPLRSLARAAFRGRSRGAKSCAPRGETAQAATAARF